MEKEQSASKIAGPKPQDFLRARRPEQFSDSVKLQESTIDRSMLEAARIDGATEVQTFFHVVFPVMFPINVVVLVITFIDSLRAFDLVWVINRGRNGLELLATEVTRNIVGEAQRIGFGSALATIMLVISTVFIIIYLRIVMKGDQ